MSGLPPRRPSRPMLVDAEKYENYDEFIRTNGIAANNRPANPFLPVNYQPMPAIAQESTGLRRRNAIRLPSPYDPSNYEPESTGLRRRNAIRLPSPFIGDKRKPEDDKEPSEKKHKTEKGGRKHRKTYRRRKSQKRR